MAYVESPNGRIAPEVVSRVVARVGAMSSAQSVRLCDAIAESQPYVMAAVASLPEHGVSMSATDRVIHLLAVIHESYAEAGIPLRQIDEAMLAEAMESVGKMSGFLSVELAGGFRRNVNVMVDSYPEQALLAYVVGHLNEHGVGNDGSSDALALPFAKAMLDCFVEAAGRKDC